MNEILKFIRYINKLEQNLKDLETSKLCVISLWSKRYYDSDCDPYYQNRITVDNKTQLGVEIKKILDEMRNEKEGFYERENKELKRELAELRKKKPWFKRGILRHMDT